MTTVTASIGELERIRELMEYKGKAEDISLKVQSSAKHVYALLKNICRLFLRRRKVVTQKFERAVTISDTVRWSSYLIRRLPTSVRFEQIHLLMKPTGDGVIPEEKKEKPKASKDHFTAINTAFLTDIAVKDGKVGNGTYENIPLTIIPKAEAAKKSTSDQNSASTDIAIKSLKSGRKGKENHAEAAKKSTSDQLSASFTDVAVKSSIKGKEPYDDIPFDIKPSS